MKKMVQSDCTVGWSQLAGEKVSAYFWGQSIWYNAALDGYT